MTMKIRLKMKNRSNRYGINRPSPSHRNKYTKYKNESQHDNGYMY